MIETLSLYYFGACITGIAMPLLTPVLSRLLIEYSRQLAYFFSSMATVLLAILLVQQLLVIGFSWGYERGALITPPLSLLLQIVTGAPGAQNGLVQQTWWVEELRLLSALCFTLPLLGLSINGTLLRIAPTLHQSKPQSVIDSVGSLLFALPLGLIIIWFGWHASIHSIVGRMNAATQWPNRQDWVWEGASSFVGFGHVWAFKALVTVIGFIIFASAYIRLQQALISLRANQFTSAEKGKG